MNVINLAEPWMEVLWPVPDFILANFVELAGTFLGSVCLAVFTTFVLNRRQEVNKAKGFLVEKRLQQYDAVQKGTAGLRKTTLYSFQSCPKFLTDYNAFHEALSAWEDLVSDGLYILDDDVLEKMIAVQIYLRNIKTAEFFLETYRMADGRLIAQDRQQRILSGLYQYIGLDIYEEWDELLNQLQSQIRSKEGRVRIEKRDKDYRKMKKRRRLMHKTIGKSRLIEHMSEHLAQIGVCICEEYGLEGEARQKEIQNFLNYMTEKLTTESVEM